MKTALNLLRRHIRFKCRMFVILLVVVFLTLSFILRMTSSSWLRRPPVLVEEPLRVLRQRDQSLKVVDESRYQRQASAQIVPLLSARTVQLELTKSRIELFRLGANNAGMSDSRRRPPCIDDTDVRTADAEKFSPEKMIETNVWQRVTATSDSRYVFSAFLDRRWIPKSAVVIIGLSDERLVTPGCGNTFCRFWYRVDNLTTRTQVTPAYCRYSYETHYLRYSPSFFTCFVRDNDVIPYAVSLVNDPCDKNPPQNLLKVLTSSDYDVTSQVNFTVCVTPFNYRYDNVRQLVEMIEVNRIFGAQHFIFYNYSSGPNVTRYLDEFYRKYLDIVTVVPWPLPMPVDVWPPNPQVTPEIHYFGQVAALNDCLYRCIVRRSTFSVFTDLDEIIVPRRRDSWSAMLDDVTTHWQRTKQRSGTESLLPGSYVFRNTFFRTDWTQDQQFAERGDEYQLLDTVLTTEREEKVFQWNSRSKYITWSNAAVMVGVHFSADRYRDVDAVMVDVPDALLHHYRQWKGEDDPVNPPTRIIDRHMHRYADKIARRTAAVHTFMIDGTRESEFKLSTIRNAT